MSKVYITISSDKIDQNRFDALRRIRAFAEDMQSENVDVEVDVFTETELSQAQARIRKQRDEIAELRSCFRHLHGYLKKLLIRPVSGELLLCDGLDLKLTKDRRTIIFAAFERTDLPVTERLKHPRWSGYFCPNCASTNVKRSRGETLSSGNDFAVWNENFFCEDCSDTWQSLGRWSD